MKKDNRISEIIKEISLMVKEDQKMRKSNIWDHDLDKKNTTVMKRIVEEIGWPTISKVGEEASHNAWLLVQHADHDPKFQKYCLELMKNLPNKEIPEGNIAYLEDRVLVNHNEKQIYGTQFYTNKDGGLVPRPIMNIKQLDKRRKEAGLNSFKEYTKQILNIPK